MGQRSEMSPRGRGYRKVGVAGTAAVMLALFVSACTSTHGESTATTTSSGREPTTFMTTVPGTTPSTIPTTTTTTPPPPTTTTAQVSTAKLSLGSAGPAVLTLQKRLISLGYWLGTANGTSATARSKPSMPCRRQPASAVTESSGP